MSDLLNKGRIVGNRNGVFLVEGLDTDEELALWTREFCALMQEVILRNPPKNARIVNIGDGTNGWKPSSGGG